MYVTGRLSLSTRDAQEAHALAKDGALGGLSIGYQAKTQAFNQRDGVTDSLEVELFEGSLVTIPSNPKTRIDTIKSIAGPRDIAELLQDGGLSNRKAKLAAGAACKAFNEQDDEAAAFAELVAITNASAARLANI